jgi:transposase
MKTLFLPQEMLIRVFLGWLRGGPLHCTMMAIPTLEDENAADQAASEKAWSANAPRIINRMKATLIRPGIRGVKPELLKTSQRIGDIDPAGRCNVGRCLRTVATLVS